MLHRLPNTTPGHAPVSILTRAEARVLPEHDTGGEQRQEFQSSPAPRRGCCLGDGGGLTGGGIVSILTRAEARVLPSASNAMNCNV